MLPEFPSLRKKWSKLNCGEQKFKKQKRHFSVSSKDKSKYLSLRNISDISQKIRSSKNASTNSENLQHTSTQYKHYQNTPNKTQTISLHSSLPVLWVFWKHWGGILFSAITKPDSKQSRLTSLLLKYWGNFKSISAIRWQKKNPL